MAEKKSVAKLNIRVPAGKVTPNPKIASVLGSRGVQIPKFCQEVSAITSTGDGEYAVGDVVTVKFVLYEDKSYELRISDSSVSDLIKRALSLNCGAKNPGRDVVAKISMAEVERIARRKLRDMGSSASKLDGAVRSVIGTARSMGIVVDQ